MKIIIIHLSLLVLLLSACSTTHRVIIAPRTDQHPVIANNNLIDEVQKNQPDYNTINISKIDASFDYDGKNINASASCKIKKDSIIHFSFQFLGFEVAKAEISTDSIRVYDKYNKRYCVTDFGFISQLLGIPINFYNLQSLLTAQLFCFGKQNVIANNCKTYEQPDNNKIISFLSNNIEQTTFVSTQTLIEQVVLKLNLNQQLQSYYTDYGDFQGGKFPQNIAIEGKNGQSKIKIKFQINKVEFNPTIRFVPLIGQSYKRINIKDILK